MWEYLGRGDDMVVFASGEKFWPGDVEQRISAHADVAAALVVGTGRARGALLLELDDKARHQSAEEVLERVWPVIQEVHAVCSPAARIVRELVVVADAERPFIRTPKGSVARGPTTRLYAQDLDVKYKTAVEKGVAAPAGAVDILLDGVEVQDG